MMHAERLDHLLGVVGHPSQRCEHLHWIGTDPLPSCIPWDAGRQHITARCTVLSRSTPKVWPHCPAASLSQTAECIHYAGHMHHRC